MGAFQGPYLVIGARGMLGTDLMKVLERAGIDAVGLDNEDVDIVQQDSVERALAIYKPRLIINVAAFTDVDGCESQTELAFAVNAIGPEHLARAAGRVGALLLHISSDYVFDGKKTCPYVEDDPMSPVGVYARSKAEGEIRIRRLLPGNHCIVRTQWLFGMNGRNFVEAILAAAQTRGMLSVVNDQHGSPTYTRDLAEALMGLCRIGYRGTINVTNSGHTTWYDFAVRIVRSLNLSSVRVEPMRSSDLGRPAPRPLYSVLDTSRYVAVAGAPLRMWEEALDEYLELRGAG